MSNDAALQTGGIYSDDEYISIMRRIKAEQKSRRAEICNESEKSKQAKKARRERRRACGATKPITDAQKYNYYGIESPEEAATCLCCVGRGIKRVYKMPRANSGTHGSKVIDIVGNPDGALQGPRPCDSERGEWFRQWQFRTMYPSHDGIMDPELTIRGKFGWPHPKNRTSVWRRDWPDTVG